MRVLILTLLCYVIASASATRAQGPEPLAITDHVTAQRLVGHLQGYLDPSGTMTIDQIVDAPFETLASRGVDYGYTPGAVWLRLRLRNPTPDIEDWRLHFRENFLQIMDVYLATGGGKPELIDRTTPTSTFNDRAVAYPEVTIPMALFPGDEATLYVMYRSDGSTQTSFEIRSRDGFTAYAAARTARNFVFYGMILFLAVAATLAYAITRRGVFAAYGAYAAAGLLFMMHADGNAFQYLWPTASAFNNYASILTGTGFIVTGAIFARQFLQTAQYHPIMDRLLLGAIFLALGAVVSTIVVETQTIKKLLVLLAFFGILLFTASGIVAARTRFREVRFYVIAWTGAMIASGIMTARHWFGINISEDTQLDAMRIVMVVDAAFMGLAILDRFNQLKQAREQALEVNLDQARRSLDLSRRLQDLEKQYGLAVELAEARGRQITDTAHDLRQPLHALRLSVQAMVRSPGQQAVGTDEIEKTFTYLEDLVATELQDRAPNVAPARRAGKDPDEAEPATESTEVGDILVGVADMLAADASEKDLALRVMPTSLKTSLPPLALMRLATNLVSNAIKYTASGRVLVGVRRDGAGLRLEVHDTGPGLSQVDFQTALGRNVRLETGTDAKGSGLGLAIVREIVENHGLEIGLLPRRDGTSIFVTLPPA